MYASTLTEEVFDPTDSHLQEHTLIHSIPLKINGIYIELRSSNFLEYICQVTFNYPTCCLIMLMSIMSYLFDPMSL